MIANDPAGSFLRVVDTRGDERYLNPAAIADVQYVKNATAGTTRATVSMMVPITANGQHQIQVSDADAIALRAELRRRMGLPDEDAPDSRPLKMPQLDRQVMPFQR